MKSQITIPTPYCITSARKLHFFFILFISITACSVFKEKSFLQADSLQKENTKRETKIKESTNLQIVRVYNHEDSSDNRLYTEIFPDGPFRYSVEEGFSGNANRVVIDARSKQGRKLLNSSQVKKQSNTVSDIRENQRLLTQSRLREKSAVAKNYTLWYLFGLLLVFVGVMCLGRGVGGL